MQTTLHAIWSFTVLALLIYPGAALFAGIRWRRVVPPWATALAIVLGGWFLAFAVALTRDLYLDAVVHRMPNPDINDPLVQEWMSDVGRRAGPILIGWLVGPVIAIPWAALFAAAYGLDRLVRIPHLERDPDLRP